MSSEKFNGKLGELIRLTQSGTAGEIDTVMKNLTVHSSLATTRFVDYALSLVINPEGIERIGFYLFNGTLIQRNYASLFFNRRDDWKIVRAAFEMGLIDEIQAFAR